MVERAEGGSPSSATVSLTVRGRIVLKTTTVSIKLRLFRAPDTRKAVRQGNIF